jgi:hypothetical protein
MCLLSHSNQDMLNWELDPTSWSRNWDEEVMEEELQAPILERPIFKVNNDNYPNLFILVDYYRNSINSIITINWI